MKKKRAARKTAALKSYYYDIKLVAKNGKRKTEVVLPTNEIVTTSTNIQPGDIIWYPAAKKSFLQTTMGYLKSWFK